LIAAVAEDAFDEGKEASGALVEHARRAIAIATRRGDLISVMREYRCESPRVA
jgi:hypothetical protein